MHVALLHEEKKPSKCSKFNQSFLTENFKRPIDVVHQGRKLIYNESLEKKVYTSYCKYLF